MNATRLDAERFLLVTQVLIGFGVLLIPILVIDLVGLVEFVKKHCMTSDQRARNRDLIELRMFIFLQLITAVAVVGEMAMPVFLVPFPARLNCTAISITVW